LPNATITAAGGAVGAPAASLLEIDVLQFDPDSSGAITLTAQAALKPAGATAVALTRRFTAQAAASSDPAATAAAMSSLWAKLAAQLAAMAVSAEQQ
jgi:hypothetical protein